MKNQVPLTNIGWFDNVEERVHPWPGLNWLTVMLVVPNVEEAINFYQQAFGIVPIFQMPSIDGEEIVFARMRYRGCNFTINKEGFDTQTPSPITSQNASPFIFYLYVDNVDEIFKGAKNQGCKVIFEPKTEFWGDKRVRLIDPYGYVWDIAKKI